ncbi:class I SAM-dependent methyltransferase [Gracilimonas sp.]|uniref:class I SAM-dependent methyltransferase n=1 Tax=Gracilimonas TaxID=649462 RepID=UPI0025BD6314|nr:class I SAM-dependent methyltransferase [Gracilimonas sp.]
MEERKPKRSKKPWPTKDAMEQVYQKNLWGGGHADFYSGTGSHHPELVEPYVEAVASFLLSFEEPPVVCDMGCGDFNVGKELVKHTKKYVGVDIVPDLIERNREKFEADHLEFRCLDIAEDEWPPADCVILRQVLQHLSNAEIQRIVSKLYNYEYIILTEHLPEGDFEPNKDIISGQGTRLKKGSGVDLLALPFNLRVQKKEQWLAVPAKEWGGVLVTTLYRIQAVAHEGN